MIEIQKASYGNTVHWRGKQKESKTSAETSIKISEQQARYKPLQPSHLMNYFNKLSLNINFNDGIDDHP